jgi:acetyl esterase/lipase
MNTFCYSKNKNTTNEKSLDLYSCPDANDKTPLVVFIHGGAWRTEDKSDYRALATDCLSLGITAVSVNYRLNMKYEIGMHTY